MTLRGFDFEAPIRQPAARAESSSVPAAGDSSGSRFSAMWQMSQR
jgi:hypothetical protein